MFSFKKTPKYVALPTSEEAFDQWATDIIQGANLPDTDDTRDALATSIMHLNQGIAFYPTEYFRDIVLKSLANKAAYGKLQGFAKKRALAQAEAEAKIKADLQVVGAASTNEQPQQEPTTVS